MADANDGDASASQNPNQDVANRLKDGKTIKRDPFVTAREEMMARIDEQVLAARGADDESFFQSADPRALAMAAEMGRESRGEEISTDSRQGRQQAAGEEVASDAQDVDPEPTATQVDDRGRDPLEDFIVREAGKPPMFKTVVDGKIRMIPLEAARTQLQKRLSAESTWAQVNSQKQALETREAQLRQREAALRAQPVVPQIDEAAFDQEATDLVRSLVSEPEAVAAKKMASMLKKVRLAATPQIDINAVGQQAASIARKEIAAEDTAKALTNGLSKFESTYHDMPKGSELYLIADRKTETIAAEHPNWSPEQVMMEAGKQTREWVVSIGGKPAPKPAQGQQPNNRQQLKQTLKPMPQSRSARPAPANDENAGESPQDAMAEIRKSRGQAY
jgi:hypothetical protein